MGVKGRAARKRLAGGGLRGRADRSRYRCLSWGVPPWVLRLCLISSFQQLKSVYRFDIRGNWIVNRAAGWEKACQGRDEKERRCRSRGPLRAKRKRTRERRVLSISSLGDGWERCKGNRKSGRYGSNRTYALARLVK